MLSHEKYELARGHIQHEDELINNRTTWFLVFQGLLFGTFFQALELFGPHKLPDSSHAKLLVLALSVLCILGAVSSLVAAAAVSAAHAQITHVRQWWEAQPDRNEALPRLAGTQGIVTWGKIKVSGAAFLGAAAAIWALLLVLLVWGAWV
jgi:hypothetical protein